MKSLCLRSGAVPNREEIRRNTQANTPSKTLPDLGSETAHEACLLLLI